MKTMFFKSGVSSLTILLVAASLCAQNASMPAEPDASKLIYADFQDLQSGRPISKHGGAVRLNVYSQNSANPPQFRGLENANPPAPAFARVTAEDVAAAFDYEFRIPNEWAGVNMEVFGEPEKDGNVGLDDVSGYKLITFRALTTARRHIQL